MEIIGKVSSIYNKPEDYYRTSRDEMVNFIPEDVKVLLDVGCAEGGFGSVLKTTKNIEVWGVELYEDAAKKAKLKLDKVLIADIEDAGLGLPVEYFDCIVFNDILEHLKDPWSVLRRVNKSLRPGGHIVASIPNIRHYPVIKDLLLQKDWRYEMSGVLDITHLRFFTKKSMIEPFRSSGYEVLRCVGIRGGRFPWKFGILNTLLFNKLDDMRFERFACVSKK